MRRLMLGIPLIVLVSTAAFALADDPIATRKKLMDGNGAAMGAAVGMVKGEIPFDPRIAMAALQSFDSVAFAFGDYFPEGSGQGDTSASPNIWSDPAKWQAQLDDFRKDAEAAVAAKPQDLEAFKAVLGPIGEDCGACHEGFRVKRN